VDPFTIAGIIVAVGVGAVAVGKALAPVRIARVKRWPAAPTVVRTPECPYSADEIAAALAWWTERGARFARPDVTTTLAGHVLGASGPLPGLWVFDLRGQGGWAETHRGHTTVHDGNGNGMIEAALSSFPRDVDRLSATARRVVLLHEVGHGLGLLEHVGRRGHVMNADYTKGGLGDRGVREALTGR
jgi:hypothetical protein